MSQTQLGLDEVVSLKTLQKLGSMLSDATDDVLVFVRSVAVYSESGLDTIGKYWVPYCKSDVGLFGRFGQVELE